MLFRLRLRRRRRSNRELWPTRPTSRWWELTSVLLNTDDVALRWSFLRYCTFLRRSTSRRTSTIKPRRWQQPRPSLLPIKDPESNRRRPSIFNLCQPRLITWDEFIALCNQTIHILLFRYVFLMSFLHLFISYCSWIPAQIRGLFITNASSREELRKYELFCCFNCKWTSLAIVF